MNVFTIAGLIGILVILMGIGLAFIFVKLSQMVTDTQMALEQAKSSTNPNLTLGFDIPVDADVSEQLAVARKIAAQRAAMQPRGANMRIGRLGATNLNTAGKAAEQDPFTAVKIAAFHTWQGARVGPPIGGAAEAAPQARQVAQAALTKKPEDLVPGEDYPFVEITDDMLADEVRSARIANARARSAAIKALKAQPAQASAATPAATPQPEPAQAEPAAELPSDIEQPDYVEITDDMPADEVRKARIQNARERSRFFKALKDRGIDPKEWEARQKAGDGAAAQKEATPAAETEPAVAAETEQRAAPQAETVEIPDHIAEPEYIEITDDMPADEVRKARIQNARERSRYFKALKDAGIDPKSVAEQG